MTAPDEQVAAAVKAAQVAQLNLVGLMVAYKISREELRLLLSWPAPVTAAFSALDEALRPLAKLLAGKDGKPWAEVSLAEMVTYTRQAHDLVMESPAPDVPHASGVAPITIDLR